MPKLLIVDDEPAIRHAFRLAFRDTELTVTEAFTAAEAVAAVASHSPDVVVLDVRLPDATGLETFHRIRAVDSRVPVLLITGHGTTDLAIEAIKAGAFDYLLKPLDLHLLREIVDRAVRSSHQMTVPALMPEMEPEDASGDRMIGRCPAMQAVYKAIGRVAAQDVTVLITGETGTGKELVARAIYQHSSRANKPFIAINCGAIPENLIESELFGHERGAFTGADRKRIGRFEQANGGTLFLDEIADLPASAQVKLLRVLQERCFERVGGEETISTDVRIIAATNADLPKLATEGVFRQDLLFRLNVYTIHLPPLRERGDDLALLIKHYVHQFGQQLNKPVRAIAPEVLARLQAYSWPGNIRQLQSVLKQAILQMRGDTILLDDLPALNGDGLSLQQSSSSAFDWDRFVTDRINAGTNSLYAQALEHMEQEVLVRVLKYTNGNQLQAAKILGITRGSLRNKIRSLGIEITRDIRGSEEADWPLRPLAQP
jgi:two-component system response regulator AtoC